MSFQLGHLSRANVSRNTEYITYEANYNDHLSYKFCCDRTEVLFKVIYGHVSC